MRSRGLPNLDPIQLFVNPFVQRTYSTVPSLKTSPDQTLPHVSQPRLQAAVVGDTVGDPLKDTSGPSLNILMKLMAIISLVFAEYFYEINDGMGVFMIKS